MGGRYLAGKDRDGPDREKWIQEVSDSRLAGYERLMSGGGTRYRSDGSNRGDGGAYFRDLIAREKARRSR